jgi:hypothetical protein
MAKKEKMMTLADAVPATWMPTKSEISRLKVELTKPVKDGDVDVKRAMVIIRALKTALADAEKELSEDLNSEIAKYNKNEVPSSLGVKIQYKGLPTKLDYSVCNDPVLRRLMVEYAEIEAKVEARQNFLKKLKQMEMITDPETGEIVEIRPPVKTGGGDSFTIQYPD